MHEGGCPTCSVSVTTVSAVCCLHSRYTYRVRTTQNKERHSSKQTLSERAGATGQQACPEEWDLHNGYILYKLFV